MAWWYLQPVALKVPDTEELIDSGPKRALISDSFSFAITKEAVYLATRKKGFLLRKPFETTRYPLSSIPHTTHRHLDSHCLLSFTGAPH
jgi:hypothetical protein